MQPLELWKAFKSNRKIWGDGFVSGHHLRFEFVVNERSPGIPVFFLVIKQILSDYFW